MSWTDKASIEHIKQLRDIFNVSHFVETGTFKGSNMRCYASSFNHLYSCEKNKEFFDKAFKNCESLIFDGNMINLYHDDSPTFLKWFKGYHKEFYEKDMVVFYLDAHFYDKKAKNKFVVLDELKALKGFKNCIIVIHDFDNNLGHITYDGQPLNLELLRKSLEKINPEFKFYTNELSSCNPKLPHESGNIDERDNLLYAWSKPEKTYRGFLYCVPKEVNIDGLKEIK